MKMAKASEKDIDAAGELHQILSLIDERFGGPYPIDGVTESLEEKLGEDSFDPYETGHLQALYSNLAKLLRTQPNFYGRVIGGFCYVIMYDKNQIVDLDSDFLDLHPRFQDGFDEMERQASYARYWNMRYHQVVQQRDDLLSALKAKMDNDYPFTRTVSREELTAYWEHEHKLGRGCAKDELAALAAIANCEGLL